LTKKGSEIKTMSKHGFLDMLKKTGTPQSGSAQEDSKAKKNATQSKDKKSSTGWNALKDDFLMNKKMKDWDKDISDDDESDEDEERGDKRNDEDGGRGAKRIAGDAVDDDWSDEEEQPKKEQPKKRKTKAY
jgi:hypothetical protein